MKVQKPVPKKQMPKATIKKALPSANIDFHLPPGYNLNDVFISTGEVAKQLKLCTRSVNNLRRDGKLSSTTWHTNTVYLFKQEIAGTLLANKVKRKKK